MKFGLNCLHQTSKKKRNKYCNAINKA